MEPQATIFLKHLIGNTQVFTAQTFIDKPLVVDLCNIYHRVPGCKQC